jgi:hypothetical protein
LAAPIAERKVKPSKATSKSAEINVNETDEPPSVSATSKANTPAPTDARGRRKEKKKGGAVTDEARNKKAGGPGKAAVEEPAEPTPLMIDLRVGHIVDGELMFIHIWRTKSTQAAP